MTNRQPSGPVITGIKTAVASKFLEDHPHLRVGVLAGIFTGEIDALLSRTSDEISGSVFDAEQRLGSRLQLQLQASREFFDSMAAQMNEQQQTQINTYLTHEYETKKDEVLKAILTSVKSYSESRKIFSDVDMFSELSSSGLWFDLPQLWWYRAAATLCLGPLFDYAVPRDLMNLLRREYLKRLAATVQDKT
jgi:hypothetical protein